jgi:NAD(P)-dependent dehydrogenase (short-subunit alcohol dehydrogenase family)
MARDRGPHPIRVNTLVPGWTTTERQKRLWVTPDSLNAQLAAQCLPDPIEPVYVARMALFLASDDSAMCTANNYMVERGRSRAGILVDQPATRPLPEASQTGRRRTAVPTERVARVSEPRLQD